VFEKFRSYFVSEEPLPPEHKQRLEKLKGIINTEVDNPFLFIRALRHRSILAEDEYISTDSYERLEFLGDTVLDLIVTEIIFEKFPDENEGFLTKLRAKLVKGDVLAEYANHLNLNELLVIGERARGQGIEFSKSVLADVFEALVGAIYIDQGYTRASSFVADVIDKYVDFERIIDTLDNYKSMLLEYAQAQKYEIPTYEVVSESGPGHDKTFTVRVFVDNREMGRGEGKSKKQAEQQAARVALKTFKRSL